MKDAIAGRTGTASLLPWVNPRISSSTVEWGSRWCAWRPSQQRAELGWLSSRSSNKGLEHRRRSARANTATHRWWWHVHLVHWDLGAVTLGRVGGREDIGVASRLSVRNGGSQCFDSTSDGVRIRVFHDPQRATIVDLVLQVLDGVLETLAHTPLAFLINT